MNSNPWGAYIKLVGLAIRGHPAGFKLIAVVGTHQTVISNAGVNKTMDYRFRLVQAAKPC